MPFVPMPETQLVERVASYSPQIGEELDEPSVGDIAGALTLNSKDASASSDNLTPNLKYVESYADTFDADVTAPFVACFLA